MPGWSPPARLTQMLTQSKRWRGAVALEWYHRRRTGQRESRTARVSDGPPWQAGGAWEHGRLGMVFGVWCILEAVSCQL